MIPPQLTIDHVKDIQVYDTEPNTLEKFPMIVVNSGSGNIISGGLGDMSIELTNEYGDLIGYRYGGMYELTITLEIATRSTFDREFLADMIAMALRVQLRRKLESVGILIKDVKFTGESSLQLNSDKIYVSNLTLSIWSEWYDNVELIPIDEVNIGLDLKS